MLGILRAKSKNIWTPANPGLSMVSWHDAQDDATIVQADAAGRVSQWTDKSGSNNHWLQATALRQPTTGSDNINGFNVIGFVAASQYFLAMGSNPFGATITNAALFMVINVKTVTEAITTFSLTGSATAANRWQSHVPWSDGTVYFDNGGVSGANRVNYASGWAANKLAVMGFIGSTTSSVQQIWEGGTLKIGDATGHSVSTVGNPTLGAGAGGSEHDTCAIGEVIIINGTVSEYTRVRIEGYLAHKWGRTADLPISHPCRWAPPTV